MLCITQMKQSGRGTQGKGYVGKVCRKGRRHIKVTLGPQAEMGSEVCRMYVGSMSDKGTQGEGYVGRVCRKGRRQSSVTLGPRAENGVEGMSDVCRKYVGQGDSGSCRRSEEILQDLPAPSKKTKASS